jgi:cystathionine gamma-synthase
MTDQASSQGPGRALHPETVAVSAGRPSGPGEPLNTPLITASNFHQDGERAYSRGDGTDTVAALEQAVGELEGGWGVAFASGMAAAAAILDDLPTRAQVVIPENCYQGVAMTAERGAERFGWSVKRLDPTDTDRWIAAVEAGPDLVWLESPTNPLLEVGDVPAVCGAAEAAGVPCAVDNTFATPLLQRPLDLGATWSVHSVTKFIGGHSDLLGGLVAVADPQRREALIRRQVLGGAILGGLDAFLALRGLRTLPVRLSRSQASAGDLARRLTTHPSVTRVRYPGLLDDPGYDRAKTTLAGPGAVLSFETVGDGPALDRALAQLSLVAVATSLGGVESTIERRARLEGQTHLPPTLVRLSVGCEHVDDLWNDLTRALDHLAQPT